MNTERPDNLCLRPFLTIPGGEKLFALIMAKYAGPLGLSLQSPEAPTIFTAIAQIYKNAQKNGIKNPKVSKCFIAGVWRTLTDGKSAVNLDTIRQTNPPKRRGNPDTRSYTIEYPIIPQGHKYTLKQSHGACYYRGTHIPASSFTIQLDSNTPIQYRLLPKAVNFSELHEEDFTWYQEETITVMNSQDYLRRTLDLAPAPIEAPKYSQN